MHPCTRGHDPSSILIRILLDAGAATEVFVHHLAGKLLPNGDALYREDFSSPMAQRAPSTRTVLISVTKPRGRASRGVDPAVPRSRAT
jgi:hypothetical protein